MAHRRTISGFTLLELVLVMAIVAIVMMAAAPSLSGFGRGRVAEQSAAQFVALTHWARTQAISDGMIYRMNIDTAHGRWWLTQDGGGAFVNVDSKYGRVFSVPDGVRINSDAAVTDGVPTVEFDPSGRADPASVKFTDERNNVLEVICESPTDIFHVAVAVGGHP